MFCISLIIFFSFYKFISFNVFIRLCTILLRSNSLTIFIDIFSNYSWCRSSLLFVDMFCISLIIFFSFYKFISFDIFFVFCSIFLIRNSITIFINVFCNYFWSWFYFLVDMFCISFFISFCFYKFISFNVFIRLFTIFLRSNSLTIFIDIFCNYSWCRSSFLFVDMFCISLIIFFSFYKFISFNVFIRLCTILLRSNSLTIFIDIFSNYSWCRSSLLFVDMFCISLIIFFSFYKFISFNVFIRLCTILLRSNSLTIFVYVFCNYIWGEFPCSCDSFVLVRNCYWIFVVWFEFPSSLVCFISVFSVFSSWNWGCYFFTFYFSSYFFWCFCF